MRIEQCQWWIRLCCCRWRRENEFFQTMSTNFITMYDKTTSIFQRKFANFFIVTC